MNGELLSRSAEGTHQSLLCFLQLFSFARQARAPLPVAAPIWCDSSIPFSLRSGIAISLEAWLYELGCGFACSGAEFSLIGRLDEYWA